MGKKSGAKQEVNEYRLSMHLGIAVECDSLNAIYVGDKTAFEGTVTGGSVMSINKPELFGGVKKEGGLGGLAYFLSGSPTQVLPAELAGRFDRTSATCPAFRGLSSIFFIGKPGNGVTGVGNISPAVSGNKGATRGTELAGFMWGANTPYLKSISAKVTRAPRVPNLDQRWQMNANPAHMIYECLINDDWGMGAPDTILDLASFNLAAQKLHSESFSLAMLWTRQASIESFVNEIIDHIQGTVFVNPRTGLLTLKLVRDDYNLATLRTITPDNSDLSNFQRKALGETINEIVVTWTNPENEQEETVSAQDIASIVQQGGIVSDNRNYYGVRNGSLATTLCLRDLRQAAAPLVSCEVELDRQGWDILPGDVVKLNWPEYGVTNIIMRVGNVDYGKPGEPYVKVSLLEDIFSLGSAQFTAPATSLWEELREAPAPLQYTRLFTTPGYFLGIDITELTYPEAAVAIIGATSSSDTSGFEILAERTQANGVLGYVTAGSKNMNGVAALTSPLSAESLSSAVAFTSDIGGPGPDVSAFVMLGSGNDAECEIALLREKTVGGGWTLDRGVLDTIPRAWPIGTQAWFLDPEDGDIFESERRAEGETANYKLLTRTSLGLLSAALAPIISVTVGARPHLPNRPANVNVGGVAFQTATAEIDATAMSSIPVTWANRNRTMEDSQILRWTDGTIPPEDGQTTTVSVLSRDRTLIIKHAGLTGTSFTLPLNNLGAAGYVVVRIEAERAGFTSLQAAEFRVKVATGYGLGYGLNYGGA